MSGLRFPEGFVWGTATASYQIEGAVRADGRGVSIWDTFSATPGATLHGHTGDVACEHYERYADDVRLMTSLGLDGYRFSVAWPRIQPDGTGPVNTKGLDFYDRLTDQLCAAGIKPLATLYHWDLPQGLEDRGGWTNRDTAEHFAEYASIVASKLADRVDTWFTLNEPWCSAFLGYAAGVHAPGVKDDAASFKAAHHLLLAHGLAVPRLREAGAKQVSIALNTSTVRGEDPASVALVDGLANRLFLDPVLLGSYPADMLKHMERFAPLDYIREGDAALIHQPIDLLGLNWYTPTWVAPRDGAESNPVYPGTENIDFTSEPGPVTDIGWRVAPDGLRDMLVRLHADYDGVPILITENGASYATGPGADGEIDDAGRVAYLDGHLRACHAAIQDGVNLLGYTCWSLMDNFEWAFGYTQRFGLVHVDYRTQRRTPKSSAHWYREVIARNGLAA